MSDKTEYAIIDIINSEISRQQKGAIPLGRTDAFPENIVNLVNSDYRPEITRLTAEVERNAQQLYVAEQGLRIICNEDQGVDNLMSDKETAKATLNLIKTMPMAEITLILKEHDGFKADLIAAAEIEHELRGEIKKLKASIDGMLFTKINRELTDRHETAEARVVAYDDTFQQITSWINAYPLDIFPEPDFKKAHELLTANGMTLDSISASNMRHVLKGIQKIIDTALTSQSEEK